MTIIESTQRWVIHTGWYYRECWVRLPDGTVALYAIPEGPVGKR
jgi:hypothetical protein